MPTERWDVWAHYSYGMSRIAMDVSLNEATKTIRLDPDQDKVVEYGIRKSGTHPNYYLIMPPERWDVWAHYSYGMSRIAMDVSLNEATKTIRLDPDQDKVVEYGIRKSGT